MCRPPACRVERGPGDPPATRPERHSPNGLAQCVCYTSAPFRQMMADVSLSPRRASVLLRATCGRRATSLPPCRSPPVARALPLPPRPASYRAAHSTYLSKTRQQLVPGGAEGWRRREQQQQSCFSSSSTGAAQQQYSTRGKRALHTRARAPRAHMHGSLPTWRSPPNPKELDMTRCTSPS